jgi:hypothetical protein
MISECTVHECSYNAAGACHARAITVGDEIHPHCDTFVRSRAHCDPRSPLGSVGACKVTACKHNRDLACQAPSIRVGYREHEADCLTFAELD